MHWNPNLLEAMQVYQRVLTEVNNAHYFPDEKQCTSTFRQIATLEEWDKIYHRVVKKMLDADEGVDLNKMKFTNIWKQAIILANSQSKAASHLLSWGRRWEACGKGLPKAVATDNGGEFQGEEYQAAIRSLGAAWDPGAPYIPESQGAVERKNRVIKRALLKFCLQKRVPLYTWPAFTSGVAQQLNETASASCGCSSHKIVWGVKQGIFPLSLGDEVKVIDPRGDHGGGKRRGEPVFAIFGSVLSSKVVFVVYRERGFVVYREKGQWKALKVHPSRVSLRYWNGIAQYEGAKGREGMAETRDVQERIEEGLEELELQGERVVLSDECEEVEEPFSAPGEPPAEVEADAPAAPIEPYSLKGIIAQKQDGAFFPAHILREASVNR
uniref:Integrase catalytic domain-containing protein n=1 Tax=Chromera velia CCMP2878 TaxID=1169474 RepID=A0A0G4GYQ6_9ALVE